MIRAFLLRESSVALACLLLLFHCAEAAQDNFDDGNDTGWTRYDPLGSFGAPATYTFLNGAYRIEADPSPDFATLGPGRAGSFRLDEYTSAFSIGFSLEAWDNTLNQSFGAAAFATSIGRGTTDGYLFSYSTAGMLNLSRIDDDQITVLKSLQFTLDPGRKYYFIVSGQGTGLLGDLFDYSDLANPIRFLSVLDSTYKEGSPGLWVSSNDGLSGADATFDNFFATSVPEPSSGLLWIVGLGAIGLVLYRRRSPRT